MGENVQSSVELTVLFGSFLEIGQTLLDELLSEVLRKKCMQTHIYIYIYTILQLSVTVCLSFFVPYQARYLEFI